MKTAEEVMGNFMQMIDMLGKFSSVPLPFSQKLMGYTYDAVAIMDFLNELDEGAYYYGFSIQVKSNSIGPVYGEKIIKLGTDAQVRLNNGDAFFERFHDGKIVEAITLDDCAIGSFSPSEFYPDNDNDYEKKY